MYSRDYTKLYANVKKLRGRCKSLPDIKGDGMDKQISFFDKPRVVFIKDRTEINKDFKIGIDFQLFMETPEHYHIFHDEVFYGVYKESCRKVK